MVQIQYVLIIAIVLSIWLFLRIRRGRRKNRVHMYREVLVNIFFLYGCTLFVATMRPFSFQLPTLGARKELEFDTQLFEELSNMAEGSEMYQLLYSLGNVAMLMPFGLLLPMIYPFARNIFVTVFLGLTLSFSIEMTQMLFTVTRKGTVDDLVFNTVGALIGYVLFQIIGYRAAVKKETKTKTKKKKKST